MTLMQLRIKKKECGDTCPIPLELIPHVEKRIKKIQYDKKTEVAKVIYDGNALSEREVIEKIKDIGYEVRN